MTVLSDRKIETVRTIVQMAPDRIVGNLRMALAETPDDSALGGVRRLVEAEVRERTLRNTVLQPVMPMFVGAGDDPRRLTFPARVPTLLWCGLRRLAPADVEEARVSLDDGVSAADAEAPCDRLVALAAAGLRDRVQPDLRLAAELCDAGRAGGAELLAACLDIAPVVRGALPRLPEWIAHPGGETSAAARLAYRDAVEVAEDAGQRFFQMLAAQLANPWMVVRLISAVMDKPNERYLADSELANFGENLMADIDRTLEAVERFAPEKGIEAARALAKAAELTVHQVIELETYVDLHRDHGWGMRVFNQRSRLAELIEGHMHEAEKAAVEALPMHTPRQRVRRAVPRLTGAPDAGLVSRATVLLTLADDLRAAANYGGFSATRNRLMERLGEHIDRYTEDVFDLIRAGQAPSLDGAAAFLEIAAEFYALARGEKAAELIRRRTHAALHVEASVGSAA